MLLLLDSEALSALVHGPAERGDNAPAMPFVTRRRKPPVSGPADS